MNTPSPLDREPTSQGLDIKISGVHITADEEAARILATLSNQNLPEQLSVGDPNPNSAVADPKPVSELLRIGSLKLTSLRPGIDTPYAPANGAEKLRYATVVANIEGKRFEVAAVYEKVTSPVSSRKLPTRDLELGILRPDLKADDPQWHTIATGALLALEHGLRGTDARADMLIRRGLGPEAVNAELTEGERKLMRIMGAMLGYQAVKGFFNKEFSEDHTLGRRLKDTRDLLLASTMFMVGPTRKGEVKALARRAAERRASFTIWNAIVQESARFAKNKQEE